MIAIDMGRLDRAMALAAQAADLALHLGDHNLILVNRCGLADARIRCGRAGEAVAGLRQTLKMPLSQSSPKTSTTPACSSRTRGWNREGPTTMSSAPSWRPASRGAASGASDGRG